AALAAVGLAGLEARAVESLSGGERRRLAIATLHDATLAARHADRVLLLHGDGRWQFGDAATTLCAANLSELYRVPVEELRSRGRRVFVSG
ncbi:MAG TPA: hypothetical protein VI339_04180, partial [Steroidobacteraceae bacterium]|nr:hypothetical protein [Steroidobacteraceae bacterium]